MPCDFCGSPSVRMYQCESFDSASQDVGLTYHGTGITLESIQGWAACTPCSLLIDALDLDGLVKRAETIMAVKYKFPGNRFPPELIQHLRHTYGLFYKNLIKPLSP